MKEPVKNRLRMKLFFQRICCFMNGLNRAGTFVHTFADCTYPIRQVRSG